MPSTTFASGSPPPVDWRAAGQLYFSRNLACRHRFGARVWRVSVDGGFTCPNRDGHFAATGCIFCDPASFSPSRRMGLGSITAQIDEGVRRLRMRHRGGRFVAYFQPATNTYAPVEQLRKAYQEALAHPDILGLIVGTRPDCVAEDVLDLLSELSRQTWLTIEYGLQTIHDRTLQWINRGHGYAAFVDAHRRTRRRGLEIGVHVILGLPGESRDDMLATARELARLGIDSIKLHNLYAVRDTRLAELVASGEVRLPELAEYVSYAADFLEQLPPDCVVDRLSGDAPPQYLVGPEWCRDKATVREAIEAELRRRGSWQGRKWGGAM